MSRRISAKTAVIAAVIGAASVTGAGFGIANAMTPDSPPTGSVHQVDRPEPGDTPDTLASVDRPEPGDTPDAPGQN